MRVSYAIVVVLLSLLTKRGSATDKDMPDVPESFMFLKDLGWVNTTREWYKTHYREINPTPNWPKDVHTTFKLYTQHLSGNGISVLHNTTGKAVRSAQLNCTLPFKIIIHGWQANSRVQWVKEVRQRLLIREEPGVGALTVNYRSSLSYVQAAQDARVVALEIVRVLQSFFDECGLSPNLVHIIGHSLGAHIAGYVGAAIPGIARLTGLDPAEPMFQMMPPVVRLDPTDANFVDVIHTNVGEQNLLKGLGLTQPTGHVDFYLNEGTTQPGCSLLDVVMKKGLWPSTALKYLTCSHSRATYLFSESILSKCPFVGFKCDSAASFLKGECLSCGENFENCTVMGYEADLYHQEDQFQTSRVYLTTADDTPFCEYTYVVTVELAKNNNPDLNGGLRISLTGGENNVTDMILTEGTDNITEDADEAVNLFTAKSMDLKEPENLLRNKRSLESPTSQEKKAEKETSARDSELGESLDSQEMESLEQPSPELEMSRNVSPQSRQIPLESLSEEHETMNEQENEQISGESPKRFLKKPVQGVMTALNNQLSASSNWRPNPELVPGTAVSFLGKHATWIGQQPLTKAVLQWNVRRRWPALPCAWSCGPSLRVVSLHVTSFGEDPRQPVTTVLCPSNGAASVEIETSKEASFSAQSCGDIKRTSSGQTRNILPQLRHSGLRSFPKVKSRDHIAYRSPTSLSRNVKRKQNLVQKPLSRQDPYSYNLSPGQFYLLLPPKIIYMPPFNSHSPQKPVITNLPPLLTRISLTDSSILQIPSFLPQVPSVLPQVPSVLPDVPSVLPQVPSVVPQVPSVLSQLPPVLPQVSSVMPQVPSIPPQIPFISNQMPSSPLSMTKSSISPKKYRNPDDFGSFYGQFMIDQPYEPQYNNLFNFDDNQWDPYGENPYVWQNQEIPYIFENSRNFDYSFRV